MSCDMLLKEFENSQLVSKNGLDFSVCFGKYGEFNRNRDLDCDVVWMLFVMTMSVVEPN